MSSGLVERAQRGDHEAFDALATAAYHRLYAVARRILRDGYAAEDAVQDTLIRAWRDLRGSARPRAPSMPGFTDSSSAPARITSAGSVAGPLQVPVLRHRSGRVATDEIAQTRRSR